MAAPKQWSFWHLEGGSSRWLLLCIWGSKDVYYWVVLSRLRTVGVPIVKDTPSRWWESKTIASRRAAVLAIVLMVVGESVGVFVLSETYGG